MTDQFMSHEDERTFRKSIQGHSESQISFLHTEGTQSKCQSLKKNHQWLFFFFFGSDVIQGFRKATEKIGVMSLFIYLFIYCYVFYFY